MSSFTAAQSAKSAASYPALLVARHGGRYVEKGFSFFCCCLELPSYSSLKLSPFIILSFSHFTVAPAGYDV
jgi:hypothetical protein